MVMQNNQDERRERENGKDAGWEAFVCEVRQVLRLALPAILSLCAQQAMTVTDQIMVGHIGNDELAAASVGNTWFNLWFYFVMGMGTALDTLGATAYGAGQEDRIPAVLMSANITMSVFSFLMSVALWFGGDIGRLLFQQPPDIAAATGTFCRWLIPGVWPMVWAVNIQKALQVQQMLLLPALVIAFTFLCNIGLNVLLIRAFGFQGSSMATSLSRVLEFVLMLLVGCHSGRLLPKPAAKLCGRSCSSSSSRPDRERLLRPLSGGRKRGSSAGSAVAEAAGLLGEQDGDLDGGSGHGVLAGGGSFSSSCDSYSSAPRGSLALEDALLLGSKRGDNEALDARQGGRRWWVQQKRILREAMRPRALTGFLVLALPGGCMTALEASSFDITSLFAAWLGKAELNAHVALLSVLSFNFISFPLAVATAATIRVGALLGAGKPGQARLCGFICVALGAFSMALCGLAILLAGGNLGRLFIDDAGVIDQVTKVAPIGALLEVIDGTMGTSQGVLRGMGRQTHIMAFNLTGFWLIGVTLGYLLTFHAGLGLRGIWIGVLLGLSSTMVMNIVTQLRADWEREAVIVQLRLQQADDCPGRAASELITSGAPNRDLLLPTLGEPRL